MFLIKIQMIRAVYFSFCTATVKKATESFSIPRLASSILICRKNPLLIAPYDYEVLLLKRMSQRSFANALAFPGGRVEEADITNTAKTQNLLKTTALRQLFEETGLFLSKSPILSQDQFSYLSDLHKQITAQALQGSVKLSNIYDQLCQRFQLDRSIEDIIRLITIPTMPTRYDTTFFSKLLTPHHYINIHSLMSHGVDKIQDTNKIILDDYEHSSFEWLTPDEVLKRFYKNEAVLVPPQFIILNIMTSFRKYEQSVKFFKSLKDNGLKKEGIDSNPLFYPQVVNIVQNKDPQTTQKYPFAATFIGDKDFSFDKFLKSQKSQNLKDQLSKYKEAFANSTQLNRILFTEPKPAFNDYEIRCTAPFSPLLKMVGYEQLQKRLN